MLSTHSTGYYRRRCRCSLPWTRPLTHLTIIVGGVLLLVHHVLPGQSVLIPIASAWAGARLFIHTQRSVALLMAIETSSIVNEKLDDETNWSNDPSVIFTSTPSLDNRQQKQQQQRQHTSTVLQHAMEVQGIFDPTRQQTIFDHLARADLMDLSTLRLLVQDFVHRPEAVSTFLIHDFGIPPLISHQIRAIIMSLLQVDKEVNHPRFGNTESAHFSLNGVNLQASKYRDQTFPINPETLEAEVGSFTSSEQRGTYECVSVDDKLPHPDPPTVRFTGYHKTFVNEKATQRRRKTMETTSTKLNRNRKEDFAANTSSSYEYGLPNDYEAVYPTLASELSTYYEFMTQPSTQSQEDPIRPATATVYLRHAKLFLGWYVSTQQERKQNSGTTPSNEYLSMHDIFPNKEKDSANTLIEFIMWLRTDRQVSVAYEANILRGLIKFLKFRFANESDTDSSYGGTTFIDIPIIKEVRKLHRAANQKQRLAPKSSDEQKKWLSWPEYLQVIQRTKDEVVELIHDFERLNKSSRRYRKTDSERIFSLEQEEIASAFQRYLILAIFATIPDRQRTIRELQLGRTLLRDHQGQWYIKHGPDDYKTGKVYGERPPMQLAPELTPDLNDFVENWRPALRPTTDFLFAQARTGNPMTGDSVFQRVTRACFKYTGKRTNPHLLRSMIITHVREESNASEQELEALALFMGHSIQMQRSSYDKRTLDKKIAPAIQLMQDVNTKKSVGI